MNKYLDLIPTPKTCDYTEGGTINIKKVYCDGEKLPRLQYALDALNEKFPFSLSDEVNSDLIITHDEKYLNIEELSVFNEKYADEQGYVLKKEDGKPVIICAKTDIGCLYAVMTLLQLADKDVKSFVITDYPDFKLRGNKWTIWAESGAWSFDFGDGAEAIKKRVQRLLDMNARYKINAIYMDAFGLSTERFPEYSDIMRFANDEGRKRGIKVYTGAYLMGYGQQGTGTFQGKTYLNRKSYPDGEVYECLGSYMAYNVKDWVKKIADYSTRRTTVEAREHGTCLSNDALLDLKVEEMKEYLVKTHASGLYLHEMDAYEIHPELWMARCENCRKKWPNDSLFAEDGAAGAFAEYFNKLGEKLATVKDGDYDASRDLSVMVISPGYAYAELTNDEDFDTCMKFWGAVSKLIKNDIITIGFREQFFYHDKNVRRAESISENGFEQDTTVINFSGGDGFYDDHILAITAVFNYMLKGYDGVLFAGGNALQEPMQVFDAEYLWASDNSGFYNIPRPENQKDFVKLYHDTMDGKFRPEEIFGDGGLLDIICESIYGKESGKQMSEVYKMYTPDGAHPILSACCRTIYTHSNSWTLNMVWDYEDLTEDKILAYKKRFGECAALSKEAVTLMEDAIERFQGKENHKKDMAFIKECFNMGTMLCTHLEEYMGYYHIIDKCFRENTSFSENMIETLNEFRAKAADFRKYLEENKGQPLDFFGGAMIRRDELGEFLDYQPSLMIKSIETNKRVPDDRRPWRKTAWW
ncbi:MAG: hypothetical protein E7406_07985 [Ruminococcaceae bacterium]|nr:hypothetical protein [Oscillospiraceae bacterium]